MSEFFNVTLLGIVGTATGIVALLISYRTYSKQKPNLKIKVTKCVHDFPNPISEPQVKDINFWTNFQIKNVGDRGTKVENIILSFVTDAKKYKIEEKTPYSDLSEITGFQVRFPAQNESRWIEAHDTVNIGAHFNMPYDGREDRIDCVFSVYDTHRKYTVKGISTKVERPPLMPGPYKKQQ